jgi:hypothetical protein
MNLETLFEDIESAVLEQRVSQNSILPILQKANRLEICTNASTVFHLVAPVVGTDFFAGLNERDGNWVCIAFAQCRRALFSKDPDSELPKLRFQSVALETFLMPNKERIAVTFKSQGGVIENALVTAVSHGQLWFQNQGEATVAAALAGLEWLQIIEFTDSSDLVEWLGR